jgi:hypothetical protein
MNGGARIGEATLRRTYRASVLVFATALLVSLGMRSAFVSLGVAAGYAIAILILLSWQFIVRHALAGPPRGESPARPGESSAAAQSAGPQPAGRKGLAIGLGLAKFPILLAVTCVLIGRGLVSPEAFVAGFLIPQLTLVLLAVGRLGTGRKAAPDLRPRPRGRAFEGGLGS